MKNIVKCVILLVLSLLAACGCSKEDPMKMAVRASAGENRVITGNYDETLSVACRNGIYVGRSSDGVLSFKGIPYAEPPVGPLRWKAPVDAADREGVFEAYYFGKSPIQTEWPSEPGSYYPQSEDCLTLNIWVNTEDRTPDKPVMVFIHGGSYGWGAVSWSGKYVKHDDDYVVVMGKHILKTGHGTCDNYSAAFVAMARRLGLNAYFARGYAGNMAGYMDTHEIAIVTIAGVDYSFDPQIDDYNSRPGNRTYSLFCKPFSSMTGRYRGYNLANAKAGFGNFELK